MKKFEVTLAFDVACYATIAVEAKDRKQAIKQAMAQAGNETFDIEWDSADDYRVVDVQWSDEQVKL